LKIAYLTAGAAGMFCGSCMHDNTLARAMHSLGHEVTLAPLYTPIRTDEASFAVERVFYGGINVYLEQNFGLYRQLPRWMVRWLDRPAVIRWATGFGISTEASALGGLAVSVLRGMEGNQRADVERLAAWLAEDLQPEVIVFTNMLVAGGVPEIKRRLNVPVVVTLQGDDIFLNGLVEPFRAQAIAEMARLDQSIDAYLTNSTYYADYMAAQFSLSRDKFHIIPLGIDTLDFESLSPRSAHDESPRPLTIGYLARLAPEKGLHVLVEAFELLKQRPEHRETRLHLAGWLGAQHKPYAKEQFDRLRRAGHHEHVRYHGEVDRQGKLEFLAGIDLLSVPTVYHEPKGLFVLEALAAGVPVVQPAHGAFPELIAATSGGLLVRPGDSSHLADTLHALLLDPRQRQQLGAQGRAAVLKSLNARHAAERTVEVLQHVCRLRMASNARV
jgi:glycosyltransferase involved in cell wall biosynthesis